MSAAGRAPPRRRCCGGPDAHITVLDVDPVLLALTATVLPHVRTVRADLGTAQWLAPAGGPYDVVLALMTVHYLPEDRVRDWYAEARQLLRPGGLLLVGDVMRDAPSTAPPLADTGVDPWTAWWTMLAGEPAMARCCASGQPPWPVSSARSSPRRSTGTGRPPGGPASPT